MALANSDINIVKKLPQQTQVIRKHRLKIILQHPKRRTLMTIGNSGSDVKNKLMMQLHWSGSKERMEFYQGSRIPTQKN